MLQALGLDPRAAVIYTELLAHPGAVVATLCERTGMKEEQVRATIVYLGQLGLVHSGQLAANELLPTDPVLAVTTLLKQHEADIALRQQELDAARAAAVSAAVSAAAAWSATDANLVSRLARLTRSGTESLALATQLVSTAATECIIALPNLVQFLLADQMPLTEIVAPEVRLRLLCGDMARTDPRVRAILDDLAVAGIMVRTTPLVPLPLIATDRQACLIWPGPDLGTAAMMIEQPAIAATLASIADGHWEIATPLADRPVADQEDGLAEADRVLLSLLSAGLTDEAIARRLGTSLRTVRRRASRLMDLLTAKSRFQAGVAAARRDWV